MLRDSCDVAQDPAERARLDEGTQLGRVALRWWPDAGEAVAFVWSTRADDEDGLVLVDDGEPDPVDPVLVDLRRQDNRLRAARRARGTLRRYIVANGLTRMASLTYAPSPAAKSVPSCGQAEDPPESSEAVHSMGADGRCLLCSRPFGALGLVRAMEDAAVLTRRLRASLGGDAMPYALVPEFHADGHVHLHLLVGVFVPKPLLARLWGHGFVDVRRFKGGAVAGGREAARRAAAYASKYVSKTFDALADERVAGRHRYEVAEGFQPAVVKRGGYRSLEAAVDFVLGHGCELVHAVHSAGLEDYEGPPFLWVSLEASA